MASKLITEPKRQSGRNRRLEPSCKQHTAVNDVFGVVLDVQVTTGQANEGDHILPLVTRWRR